jgi:adenine-specific DNA methylase
MVIGVQHSLFPSLTAEFPSTRYISNQGIGVDYCDFCHFQEGLAMYDEWGNHIDRQSKHRRLQPEKSEWTDKKKIYSAFDQLFRKFADSHLIVSCRSDGIPSESDLLALLKKYQRNVRVEHYGQYQYVLSTNSESKEILFIRT